MQASLFQHQVLFIFSCIDFNRSHTPFKTCSWLLQVIALCKYLFVSFAFYVLRKRNFLQKNKTRHMQLKAGITGFGISAKVFHAPFLKASPHFVVTTVFERSKEESKTMFPDSVIVRSFEALLATDVDVVVITTPNDTHYPYALQALQAGKHVVVEKPFTIYSKDALHLLHVAKETGKTLNVYHNRRYVSDYFTIKEILDKKLLGDVHTFEAHYDRYRAEARPNAWREKPQPGSGIWYDLGAHIIDQTLTYFGLPQTITADLRCQRPHAQAIDWFNVWLDYGFLQVTLKAGMLVREPGPRYLVHGTKGSFIKYGEDPQEAKLRAGEMPYCGMGAEPESMYGLLVIEKEGEIIKEKYPSHKGDYGLFYEDLYYTIAHSKPLQVQPWQAYNVVKIIELGIESSKQKRTLPCEGLLLEE